MTDTTQARAASAIENMERDGETLRSEMPSSLIDLFDKTLKRTKDVQQKMSAIIEHSTGSFEEAVSCANRGSTEYRAKLLEIARDNANAAFDLAREACGAKSFPELMELTLAHHRKQVEAAASQFKELSALTQKVVSETAEPIRSSMTEPFRLAS